MQCGRSQCMCSELCTSASAAWAVICHLTTLSRQTSQHTVPKQHKLWSRHIRQGESIRKVSISTLFHYTVSIRASTVSAELYLPLCVSHSMLCSHPMGFGAPAICLARWWARNAKSGWVTTAMHWIPPTTVSNLLCSKTVVNYFMLFEFFFWNKCSGRCYNVLAYCDCRRGPWFSFKVRCIRGWFVPSCHTRVLLHAPVDLHSSLWVLTVV